MFIKIGFYFLMAIGVFIILSEIAFFLMDGGSILKSLLVIACGLIPIFIALIMKGGNGINKANKKL